MNVEFMRLLAQRLERVSWMDTRDADTWTEETFDGVDGFFMSADAMTAPARCDVLCYGDSRVGSIAAWAAQLVREQGGYHDEDRTWIEAPARLQFDEVNELSWRALGLGKKESTEDGCAEFVLQGHLADALLSPSLLHGRMRGIGPKAAAAVLRRCADGMTPQQAWALVAQELRESRLRELADVLDNTPHALDAAWGEPTPDWSSGDLDKLTHFSMLSRYRPSVMKDGGWCGDLAMWTWKLYGTDAERYFGLEANVGLAACTMLGLTPPEGSALFEVGLSPEGEAGIDPTTFCHVVTPALAAYALRELADGVFPSFMWDDVQYHMDLDEWLVKVLGGHDGDSEAPLSGLSG